MNWTRRSRIFSPTDEADVPAPRRCGSSMVQTVFRDNTEAAINRYYKTLDLICATPGLGRPVPERDAREYAIPRIPFSVIYRIKADTIEVLRVWDQRADRLSLWEKA